MGLCNQKADNKVLATVVNRGDYPSHGSFRKHNSGGLAYLIFAELKHDNLTIRMRETECTTTVNMAEDRKDDESV